MACQPHPGTARSRGEVVVRAPALDGIGHALRGTFAREASLPTDMLDCLYRLDRIRGH